LINGQRLAVVMPAYNAEVTLERTYAELPRDIVDTVAAALDAGADIVVVVHPDYQYTLKLVRALAGLIAEDVYDVVLGSRILGNGALVGGVPRYKYVANRLLTFVENLLIGQRLSEYHTGYRAVRRSVLESVRLDANSEDFVFDNEMLVQCCALGYRIGEVSCPTRYFDEASSINFRRSVVYGFGCLGVGFRYFLHRFGLRTDAQFVRAATQRGPDTVPAPSGSVNA
jgi:Glycosyl transferase family 2